MTVKALYDRRTPRAGLMRQREHHRAAFTRSRSRSPHREAYSARRTASGTAANTAVHTGHRPPSWSWRLSLARATETGATWPVARRDMHIYIRIPSLSLSLSVHLSFLFPPSALDWLDSRRLLRTFVVLSIAILGWLGYPRCEAPVLNVFLFFFLETLESERNSVLSVLSSPSVLASVSLFPPPFFLSLCLSFCLLIHAGDRSIIPHHAKIFTRANNSGAASPWHTPRNFACCGCLPKGLPPPAPCPRDGTFVFARAQSQARGLSEYFALRPCTTYTFDADIAHHIITNQFNYTITT